MQRRQAHLWSYSIGFLCRRLPPLPPRPNIRSHSLLAHISLRLWCTLLARKRLSNPCIAPSMLSSDIAAICQLTLQPDKFCCTACRSSPKACNQQSLLRPIILCSSFIVKWRVGGDFNAVRATTFCGNSPFRSPLGWAPRVYVKPKPMLGPRPSWACTFSERL